MKTPFKSYKRHCGRAPKPTSRPAQKPSLTSEELHRRLTERYRQLMEMPYATFVHAA